MRKILIILLSMVLVFTGCKKAANETGDTADNKLEKYEHTFFDTFDTIIKFVSYQSSQEEFDKYKDIVVSEFQRLHKLYDGYNNYDGINNIKTVNDNAGKGPIEVDPDLIGLIEFSKDNYKKVSNKTNIAMGSVLKIWHDYREKGIEKPETAKIPSLDELQAVKDNMNIDNIKVNKKNNTVELTDEKMSVDLGAVAKGYATELIAKKLVSEGMESGIISAGGNVRTIGKPQDGVRDKWGIGIQNPDNALGKSDEQTKEVLYVENTSVVTSGDYQRFYTVDGKTYHHLIDPEELMPMTYFRSVSVVTEDSGIADFLSTAAYLMPFEESKKFIESYKGAEALWIMNDNSIEATEGLLKSMKSQGATSTNKK